MKCRTADVSYTPLLFTFYDFLINRYCISIPKLSKNTTSAAIYVTTKIFLLCHVYYRFPWTIWHTTLNVIIFFWFLSLPVEILLFFWPVFWLIQIFHGLIFQWNTEKCFYCVFVTPFFFFLFANFKSHILRNNNYLI